MGNFRNAVLYGTFALVAASCDLIKKAPQAEAPATTAPVAAAPAAVVDENAPVTVLTPPPYDIPKGTIMVKGLPFPIPAKLKDLSLKKIKSLKDEEFSNGQRVGHVTKISIKEDDNRFIREAKFPEEAKRDCKSWEGELIIAAGGNTGNNAVGADGAKSEGGSWPYSVSKDRPEIIAQLQKASKNQHMVQLLYSQNWYNDPCEHRTPYEVVGVTDVQPKPTPPKIIYVQPKSQQ